MARKAEDKKNKFITFRATDEEKAIYNTMAKNAGFSGQGGRGEFLRAAAVHYYESLLEKDKVLEGMATPATVGGVSEKRLNEMIETVAHSITALDATIHNKLDYMEKFMLLMLYVVLYHTPEVTGEENKKHHADTAWTKVYNFLKQIDTLDLAQMKQAAQKE